MTIVEELRKDRESGAKRLESEYRAGLLTLARRLCADEGDAEELVNRTFSAVVEGIDDYLEQSAFFGWMSQILVNLHAKDVRRASNRNEFAAGDAVEGADDADAAARIFRAVDAGLLREAVEALPPDQREAVVLHYFLDQPVAKIAKVLAVPPGTVKSRLHYARLALAAKLGTQRPGVKLLVLGLLLAAGLAMGGALYALGAALFQSHAENAESAEPVSHAESAEVVSHAESAEFAEFVSHAESAEPASPTISTSSTSSTASTPEPSAMKTSLLAVASLSLFATPSPAASSYPLEGGTRTFVGDDVVNTFTDSGTLVVHEATTVRALFVAGGGGGGGGVGGGGGGGGVVQVESLTLAPGNYVVTVGAGGAGGTGTKAGAKGGDTTLEDANGVAVTNALPALGGGFGGAWNYRTPGSGGCGGASCGGTAGAAGTPGQGFAGGLSYARSSGGGGGAGGPGGDGGNNTPRSPSAVGGVGVTNDISGVAVAYGGGGGGGGGDYGATPGSPGTDGGGDGTGYNTGLPGGDGADGRGGGGGGSGWGNTKDGGRGGSGIVILRYAFDASNLATPTVSASSSAPGVGTADVVVDVVSFGRNATSLSVVATARPAGGGEVVTQTFPNVPAGISTLTIRGLSADVAYELSLVATNDRNQSTASLSAGTVTPVAAYARATGGESFPWKHKRQIHVFTNATDTLVVEKGGFADVLLVGGGGAGGTSVGGGGGGGGVVYRTGVPLAAGTYVVSVGRGGDSNGKNGGDTTFAGFVAFGGGGGGGWGPTAGNPGGSGGGSCGGFAGGAGTPGQGYEGGLSGNRSSSGGGGAGGPGGDGGTATPRPSSAVGGIGFACSITGVEVRYGGGGGGGGGDSGNTPASPGTDGGGDGSGYNTNLPGGDGVDGLGAGGGGSGFGIAGTARGGYGGCGTVIVAYDLPTSGMLILVK